MRPEGSGRKKGSGEYVAKVTARVTAATAEALDLAAEDLQVKPAELIRLYIDRGLKDDGYLTETGELAKRRKS